MNTTRIFSFKKRHFALLWPSSGATFYQCEDYLRKKQDHYLFHYS